MIFSGLRPKSGQLGEWSIFTNKHTHSFQGNKLNNIDVVYTMWANLKKTGNMAVGQVGFHSEKQVKKV